MSEREIDFSKGKRGAIVRAPKGKTRITIRIDDDLLDYFRDRVEAAGSGNYQSMINQALREFVDERPANEALMSRLDDIERLLKSEAALTRRKPERTLRQPRGRKGSVRIRSVSVRPTPAKSIKKK